MKKTLWFVCGIIVSLTCNARQQEQLKHADSSDEGQHVLFIMPEIPDFPTNVPHRLPIQNIHTGEIVAYAEPSIAKLAYIIHNVPREYRPAVFQEHGITINISCEYS